MNNWFASTTWKKSVRFIVVLLLPPLYASSCGETNQTPAPTDALLNTDSQVTADFDEQVNRYLALNSSSEADAMLEASRAAKEASAARAAETASAAEARAAAAAQAEEARLRRISEFARMEADYRAKKAAEAQKRCEKRTLMTGWLPPLNNYGKPITCTCPKGKVYFGLTGHCIDLNEFPKRPLLTQGRMMFNPENRMCYGAVNPISIDIMLANGWVFSDLNCQSRACQPIPSHLRESLLYPNTAQCYTPRSTCELDDLTAAGWQRTRSVSACKRHLD